MARPPRTESEVNRARDALLDAALRVAARRGPHALTVEEVAREAGCSPASLYNYFAGREQLFKALVERAVLQWVDITRGELPLGITPEQRLEWIALRLLQVARSNVELLGLLLSHGMVLATDAPASISEVYMQVHGEFMAAMTEVVAGLEAVPKAAAPELAYSLVGLLYAETFRWIVAGAPSAEEMPRRAWVLTRLFLGGLPAALAPDPV